MKQGKSFFIGNFLRYFFLITFSFVFSFGTPSANSSCGTCNISNNITYSFDNHHSFNINHTQLTWDFDSLFSFHLSCGGGHNPPPPKECKTCAGGINKLVLQYTGTEEALVEVYADCGKKIFSSTLSPQSFFTLENYDNKKILGLQISIYVNKKFQTKIYTSCIKPIQLGMQFGSFIIRDGTSKFGGQLCGIRDYKEIGHVCGNVYEDQNLNGAKDIDESSQAGIVVRAIDATGTTYNVSTDSKGDYCVYNVAQGLALVSIDTTTLPDGTQLVSGENPSVLSVVKNTFNNAGLDGYAMLPPLADDMNITIQEDNNISLELKAKDYGSRPLTYTIVSAPKHGTLSGSIQNPIYTPNSNYNGNDSFTFKVSNGLLDSNIATVNIAIASVNDAPLALDDNTTTNEDENIIIDVLKNDNDIDGTLDISSIGIITQPKNGTIVIKDGKIEYIPNSNYHGDDTLSYTIKDNEQGVSNTAKVDIKILSVNDNPIVFDQNITTNEDTVADILLQAKDDDGDSLGFTIITQPQHGKLSGNSPNLSYIPDPNYHGKDSFTFKVNDGNADSNIATTNINVLPVNDIPMGVDDNLTTQQDTNATINVLKNDRDDDNDTLQIDSMTQPQNGTATLVGNQIIYKPNTNFSGIDTFTYIPTDGKNKGNVTNVFVFVEAVAPTNEGSEFYFNFNNNTSDSGGENLTVFISSRQNTSGTIEISGLNFKQDFNVTKGVVTQISLPPKAKKVSAVKEKLAVHVVAKNDITVYALNRYNRTTDAFLALPLKLLGREYIAVAYQPVYGLPSQLSIVGTKDNTTVTITPTVDIYGPDGLVKKNANYSTTIDQGDVVLFTSGYNDLTGSHIGSSEPIGVTSGNECTYVPTSNIACDHLVEMLVPLNDLGKEFLTEPLATRKADLIRVVGTENNTTIEFDGKFIKTINKGEYYDTITGEGHHIFTSKPSTVVQYSLGTSYDGVPSDPFMMIVPPISQYFNDYTVATLSSNENFDKNYINITIPTIAVNSVKLDGVTMDSTLFKPIGDSSYSGANIPINDPGSHNLKADTYFGLTVYGFGYHDSYGYQGGMFINKNNILPMAYTQTLVLDKELHIPINLKARDLDNDNLTYKITSQPQHGTLEGSGSNLKYIPNDISYRGKDNFAFIVNDGKEDSYPAIVTIVYDTKPVSHDDNVTLDEDTTKEIVLKATDAENDKLTYTLLTQPKNGTLSGIGANLVYTPKANHNGKDSFTFKVNDGYLDSNTSTVNLTINSVNDAPVANAGKDQLVEFDKNITLNGSSSSDIDGKIIKYEWRDNNNTIIGNQSKITLLPLSVGSHRFKLTVVDDMNATSVDEVIVTVMEQSLFAVAGDDQAIYEGQSVNIFGNKSYAIGSNITKYEWKEGDKVLGNSSYISYKGMEIGEHAITLTVIDSLGRTASDSVKVVVNPTSLVAYAGLDQSIYIGSSIYIYGNQSQVIGTDIAKYEWKEGDKILSNSYSYSYKGETVGEHIITLTVTDALGKTSSDNIAITVSSTGLVAYAGLDQSIYIGSSIYIYGNQSQAIGTNIAKYEWKEGDKVLSNSYYFSYKGDVAGEHTLILTVTDYLGRTASDSVQVFVNDNIDTTLPIYANAGLDQNIYLNNSVYLYGDKSYATGSSITKYEWKEGDKVLGNSYYLYYKGDILGEHTLTLTATDSLGRTASDSVKVFVNDTSLSTDAGLNQNIYLNETTSLISKTITTGSNIVKTEWKEGDKVLSNSYYFYYKGEVLGEHTLILTVTDSLGRTASDSVKVFVNDASLFVDAGLNQNTYLGQNIYMISKTTTTGSSIVKTEWKEGDKVLSNSYHFYYKGEVLGEHTLILTVTDSLGRTASDSVKVFVLEHSSGSFSANAGDDKTISFGESVILDGSLSYDLNYPITKYEWSENGTILGAESVITLSSLPIGIHHITLMIQDSASQKQYDEVIVTVTDGKPPVANAGNDQEIYVGDNATLDASQSSDIDGNIVAYEWKEGSVLLSNEKVFTKANFTVGTHTITLKVTDDRGNTHSDTVVVIVNPIADITPPLALITSPVNNTKVSLSIDIVGTASDEHLENYKLYISPIGKNDSTLIAEGNHSITNEVLGKIDASTLSNGLYNISLEAIDINGQISRASSVISIEGKAKIGNFSFTVTDFDIQVSGMPVQVNRTYSTLQKFENLDFGYGWSIDYQNVKTQENIHPGKDWKMTPDTFIGNCFKFDKSHQVNISLPDGSTETFEYRFERECGNYFEGSFYDAPKLYALNGSEAKLEAIGASDSVSMSSSGEIIDGSSLALYNPSSYRLTMANGMVYDLNENLGITKITDLRGDTLTYSTSGIVSSKGESLTFERDFKNRITKITDLSGKSVVYHYDSNDNLDYVMDQMGYKTTYVYTQDHLLEEYFDPSGTRITKNIYDDSGRLIQTIDPDGNVVEFTHDINSKQEIIKDKLGRVSVFVYDESGNVLSKTNPNGETTSYTYDAKGNELSVTDPLGNKTFNTYDAKGNLLSTKNALGHTELTAYNEHNSPTTIADKNGNTMTIEYDEYNAPESILTPSGAENTFEYDDFGNKESVTNEYGETTTYEYDSNFISFLGKVSSKGNLLKETHPNGLTIEYTYDDSSNLLTKTKTYTNSSGVTVTNTTLNTYDAFNRLTSTKDEHGNITTYSYDARGNKIEEVDAQGNRTQYAYSTSNKLILTTYADGTTESKSYDAIGNLLSQTNRDGETTGYEYDKADRLTSTIYPDGSKETNTYDAAGRVVATIDRNGNQTSYEYDAVGNKISQTDPMGNKTTYTYDAQGNMLSLTNALNQTTKYEYNALNQRIKTIYPDNTITQEPKNISGLPLGTIDENGNEIVYEYDTSTVIPLLSRVTLPNGAITSYSYDKDGSKIAQSDALEHTTTWSYTDKGEILNQTLPLGQVKTFTYDAYGRASQISDYAQKTTKFIYDANNNLVKIEYADGGSVTYDYTPSKRVKTLTSLEGAISNTYDANGRLKTQINPNNESISYEYDNIGNITKIITPTATITKTYDTRNLLSSVTDDKGTTNYTYDALGRQSTVTYPNGVVTTNTYNVKSQITNIEHKDSHGVVIQSFAYTLDNVGNKIKVVENTNRTTSYEYNNVNQLIKEIVTNDPNNNNTTTTFEYDLVGNLITKTINGVETHYVYNDNDQLISEGTSTFAYDANGNLITKDNISYSYDAQDRLVKVQTPTDTTTYTYDANNNRIAQTINNQTTSYLVDTNTPYANVITQSKGGVKTSYTYGNDLLNDNEHYFLTDALGSTRALSDASGTITNTYSYTPYGELSNHTGSSQNNFLFAGEQFDSQIGEYYLRARYYDPSQARFTSRDTYDGTLTNPITQNHYAYANANPMMYTDPSGRMSTMLELNNDIAIMGVLSTSTTYALFFGGTNGKGCFTQNAWLTVASYNLQSLSQDIQIFIMMEGAISRGDRTAEQEQQAQKEHDDYKDYCNNGPKKYDFKNDCDFWKAQIKHKEKCISMMEDFDKKWDNNRHADNAIAQWKRGLNNIKEKVERTCK